jgi:hypothetical protein
LIVGGRNPVDDIGVLQDDIKLVMKNGVISGDELDDSPPWGRGDQSHDTDQSGDIVD